MISHITLLLPTTNDDPSLYEEGPFHIERRGGLLVSFYRPVSERGQEELPLGRQALIRRAASALKYIVYNNYAVPNGIRTFFLLVDREKYQTNIDRQMLHKWYLFKYTQKEDHAVRLLSIIDTSFTQPISASLWAPWIALLSVVDMV